MPTPRPRPALLALLLVAGCGDSPAPPEAAARHGAPDAVRDVVGFECGPTAAAAPPDLSTDRSAYAPGDSLVLRLAPAAYLEHNLCHASLERRRAGRWTRERGPARFLSDADRARGLANDVCDDALYAARAGRTVCYAVRLSRRLEPGTYRFRTETTRPSLVGRALAVRESVATAPFEIR